MNTRPEYGPIVLHDSPFVALMHRTDKGKTV